MTKTFTFQYGMRYDAVTPPIELANNIVNLDITNLTDVMQVPGAGAPGAASLADPRQLQQLGAAHRHRLAAADQAEDRRARRLFDFLQRVDLQHARRGSWRISRQSPRPRR